MTADGHRWGRLVTDATKFGDKRRSSYFTINLTEKVRESTHPFAGSFPNGQKGQGWVRLKPVATNSIQVSSMGGSNPPA